MCCLSAATELKRVVPSTIEAIKVQAEANGIEMNDLQGLDVSGQKIDPKKTVPADTKPMNVSANAIVNFQDTMMKPISPEDLNNNSDKPNASLNTGIQDKNEVIVD